jgi:hypothetical protein
MRIARVKALVKPVRTNFLALRKDKVKWLDVVQAVRINHDLVVDVVRTL